MAGAFWFGHGPDTAGTSLEIESCRQARSGPIRVSLRGRLHGWSEPQPDADTELAALAARIATDGLKAALAPVDGQWALVVEDSRAGTTAFVTDHRTTHPIYMLSDQAGLSIASSVARIREHQPVPLDEDRVALFLSCGDKDGGKPLHRGCERLAAGQIVTVDAAGTPTRETWFDWDPAETHPPDLQLLRSLLFGAIERAGRISQKPIAATLSGGIDSTTVCLALRGTEGFRAYSIDAGPDADNEFAEIDETLARTEMAHRYVPASFGMADLHAMVVGHGEPVRSLKTASTIHDCARQARADGRRLIALGWGGEISFLWGAQMQVIQYVHFLVRNRHYLTLIRSIPRLSKYYGGGIWRLLRNYGRAVASARRHDGRIITRVKPAGHGLLKPAYVRPLIGARLLDLKQWTCLMLAGTALFPLPRAIETSLGIEVAAPLFSRRLIQYTLNCDSRQMMRDGHAKPVMRAALDGVVPPHIAWPPVKKNIPNQPLERIAFGRDGQEMAEAALSASPILRKMMIDDPVTAFRRDRERGANAAFWLRCIQVALLEQPGGARKGGAPADDQHRIGPDAASTGLSLAGRALESV